VKLIVVFVVPVVEAPLVEVPVVVDVLSAVVVVAVPVFFDFTDVASVFAAFT
jgi:hypothetical protein